MIKVQGANLIGSFRGLLNETMV
jgi:hypothetical protein